MTDFSDDSDVNPDEIARMVKDLDDLDNDLLGGSPTKRDTFPTTTSKDTTKEAKKKVAFKSSFDSKFNDDDDPLADPLSDADDYYDSKKSTLPNAKSNLVADLFGLKNPKQVDKNLEPFKVQSTIETPKIESPKDRIISDDSNLTTNQNDPKKSASLGEPAAVPIVPNVRNLSRENLVQTAKVNSTKPASNKALKLSLMEDLLGAGSRPSVPSKEIDTRPSFSKISLENPPSSMISEPQKSDQPIKSSSGYGYDLSAPREPRRGRRNSAIISDPLGLFTAPAKQSESSDIAANVTTKSDARAEDKKLPPEDLPEWLGGSAKSKSTKFENEKQIGLSETTSQVPPTVISSSTSFSNPQEALSNFGATSSSLQANQQASVLYPDMSMLIGSQFDQQAMMISMQQQENELRTATTLSRQNDQVSKIVECQKAKLEEQEKMFNSLIKRQIERQSMLEAQMKIQQARIDHYIQTLMAQPSSMPTLPLSEAKITSEIPEESKMENPECLVKQLQLENICLENTLAILKENQEKEIKILEASYEKQMMFMRESMDKLEKRMQHDNEALEVDYEKKLEKLTEEKYEIEQNYKDEIDRLRKKEKLFIDEIHARHAYNVELLQKEHADTINAISRAKEMERKAVDSITTNENDLRDLFNKSHLVIENFQKLQEKIENKDDKFDETRSGYLRKQEENLQLLRDQLNLQQEALTDERKRLIEISSRLDIATNEFTSEFKKKSSMINETEERLSARERTHLREKKLVDEQIEWERQHLRAMKDAWTKEQERQMKLLSEEREAVAVERSKLEVLNRLKSGSDDMAKVELEMALKTAQEAANEANQERRKWQERSRALEEQKRSLQEKENNLMHRAKELEDLTQSALMKREEGVQALKEAHRIEHQHKERLSQLQMQLENLAERENKIATEKLALARERLAARFEQPEKPEKDTVEAAPIIHYDRSFATNSYASTHFKDIVDPHLLLLKLNLDNKLDASNELLSAMQIISH